jgi:dephospho-CoA kinase
MFVLGVTGGIGCGKTLVTDGFQTLGVSVVDADLVARKIVEPSSECLARIHDHFGANILQATGELDRALLREIIFAKPLEKQWLENLLHPAIQARTTSDLITAAANSAQPYVIYSAPLLLEAKQRDKVDQLAVVDISEQLQLQRTTQRDKVGADQIRAIIASQLTRTERLAQADYVIDNSGSREQTQLQVVELHHSLLNALSP